MVLRKVDLEEKELNESELHNMQKDEERLRLQI